MQIAMIDDRMIPFEQLEQGRLDRGTFFGDGVYEVVRSYRGKLFALDEHLKRLDRSLREIGITSVNIDTIRSRVVKAFEASKLMVAQPEIDKAKDFPVTPAKVSTPGTIANAEEPEETKEAA